VTPHELRSARLKKGFVQSHIAAALGVSQAYVHMLETGKRRLSPKLAQRIAKLYDLSPETLPLHNHFVPAHTDDRHLAASLARLGYPGFGYMPTRAEQKNPAEIMLTALWQDRLDARVAEALPWLAFRYWQNKSSSNWLIEQARKFNLQNRLGFVVSLALQVAEKSAARDSRVQSLDELRSKLDESRLANEGFFFRPPKTAGERRWLDENRSELARHWNLLTDLRAEHLPYAA
jgi:transcriptional regulator with XRE-family HTH domain